MATELNWNHEFAMVRCTYTLTHYAMEPTKVNTSKLHHSPWSMKYSAGNFLANWIWVILIHLTCSLEWHVSNMYSLHYFFKDNIGFLDSRWFGHVYRDQLLCIRNATWNTQICFQETTLLWPNTDTINFDCLFNNSL